MNTFHPSGCQMLRIRDVCRKTTLSRSFVFAAVARGDFPRPVKLAPRAAAWDEAEVDAWIAERAALRGRDEPER